MGCSAWRSLSQHHFWLLFWVPCSYNVRNLPSFLIEFFSTNTRCKSRFKNLMCMTWLFLLQKLHPHFEIYILLGKNNELLCSSCSNLEYFIPALSMCFITALVIVLHEFFIERKLIFLKPSTYNFVTTSIHTNCRHPSTWNMTIFFVCFINFHVVIDNFCILMNQVTHTTS